MFPVPSQWHQCCVLLSVRQFWNQHFFCLFGLLTQLGAVSGRAQSCLPPLCQLRSQPTFAFLPFPIKREVTGMLFTPKAGQLLLWVPFPWGLTQAPHYWLPNTQRHQGHRAFLAVTLELTPTPSILVQCLISGHNVWKLRFLHKVTVQWAGNSAVLLFLRYWKLKYGQYITQCLMEAVIEGLRSKMALDALEPEMRAEMD